MLKYNFNDSDRLSEALDTKWVRRISGFYRCSLDEKGYFANLDWEPANLFYLECACDLYHVLVNDEIGVSFIGSDRRGMLFNEVARELEQLIASTDKGWNGSGGTKNVFRFTSCAHSMVREFFTLLGRMCVTKPGRKLLDSTCVFSHLSVLGSCRALDYLSRLVITSLTFTDKGFLSLNLIQIWTTTGNCSSTLKSFIHNILLALLRSDPAEFLRWGVSIISNQLLLEESPSDSILTLLQESIQDHIVLRSLISKRPNLASFPLDSSIFVRILAVEDGVQYAVNRNILSPLLDYAQSRGFKEYSNLIENALGKALAKKVSPSQLQPIVIPIDPEMSRSTASTDLFGGESVDLEGLLRIPWNIEVKLTSQAGYSATGQARDEYLRVDTFLGKKSY